MEEREGIQVESMSSSSNSAAGYLTEKSGNDSPDGSDCWRYEQRFDGKGATIERHSGEENDEKIDLAGRGAGKRTAEVVFRRNGWGDERTKDLAQMSSAPCLEEVPQTKGELESDSSSNLDIHLQSTRRDKIKKSRLEIIHVNDFPHWHFLFTLAFLSSTSKLADMRNC
ncbi:unnamed protein product [Toxocara canis]|uniref:Uncharacterized protein n=1 Tax=Toxocara canis TaxID=6265 RepID=A0A183UJZ7_TOXCA|nr:unnamed protein product [Toxocara canis]